MTKKLLALMGSERRHRSTENFLDIFIEEKFKAFDVKKIILKDLSFSNCISCYGCAKVPRCVVKDDMTDIYPLIDNSDVVIFASPIYFNSVSALSKSFIDRMQLYWSRKFLRKEVLPKNKLGFGLFVGGAPLTDQQFLGAELVLKHFFMAIGTKKYTYLELSDTDKREVQKTEEILTYINKHFEENSIYESIS